MALDDDIPDLVTVVAQAVEDCSLHLAGKPAPIQGMILAQLLAMWIGNHRVVGNNPAEQQKLWDELLQMHYRSVRELVEVE